MYSVYLFQHKENFKIYVGKAFDFQRRIKEHLCSAQSNTSRKTYFHKALKKDGLDSFQYFELEQFDCERDALASEEFWIAYFQSNKRDIGYNLTNGGDGTSGYKHTEETKRKNSEAHTGSNNVWFGKTHSQETLDKMSKTKLDNAANHEAHYEKLSVIYSGDKTNFAKIKESDMRIILTQWFEFPEETRKTKGFKRIFYNQFIDGKYDFVYGHFKQIVSGRRWKRLLNQLDPKFNNQT